MILGFTDSYYFTDNELCNIHNNINILDDIVSIYEVVRIVGGYPLFIEDHVDRLYNSLQKLELHSNSYNLKNFKNKIASLCEANQKYFGNIEIRVSKLTNDKVFCFIGFVKHNYPEPLSYLGGVLTHIMDAERNNPTAKVKDSKTRLKADLYLSQNNCFEVLLKNSEGLITEGSRSNFFFIQDNRLFSAPVNSVLAGITRKYVIQAAMNIGLPYVEDFLVEKYINNIDAAFLSGTSLGILPITKIDDNTINTQSSLLRDLMKEYNNLVQTYLSEYRNEI